MTLKAKTRVRSTSATLKRNLPKVHAVSPKPGQRTAARRAIAASVAKNYDALRVLARE